jgi:hypothetical protein
MKSWGQQSDYTSIDGLDAPVDKHNEEGGTRRCLPLPIIVPESVSYRLNVFVSTSGHVETSASAAHG